MDGRNQLGNATLAGANEDVTVQLDEELTDGDTDIVATIEVDGTPVERADGSTLEDSASVSVVAANFDVSSLDMDSNGSDLMADESADPIDVSVTVDNTGEIEGTQDIVLSVTNDADEVVIERTKSLENFGPGWNAPVRSLTSRSVTSNRGTMT